MAILKKTFLLLFTVCALITLGNAQSIKPFEKGDRISFIGNSITYGGHYHAYVWLYYMTRFPDRRITIINNGIGANAADQMYMRLEEDVLKKNPDVIFLTFGMNDAGYFEFLRPNADSLAKEKIRKSYESYKMIEQSFKQHPDIDKILISSSPYDETIKVQKNHYPGKWKAMREIAAFQEASARENNWGYIDINQQMTDITIREQAKDSLYSLALDDRIHLNNTGHMVMAYLILKAQGLAGNDISNITIDASDKRVVQAKNCKLTDEAVSPSRVSFNYLANALPYPVDTVARFNGSATMADALKVVPFTSEFNQEMLTVKGLNNANSYRLIIDSTIIGSWSALEFAQGINMANYHETPQNQQANEILLLNEERWEIEKKMRDFAYVEFSVLQPKGLLYKYDLSTLDTLKLMSAKNEAFMRGKNFDAYERGRHESIRNMWQKQLDMLADEIYRINKPVIHKITIEPVL